MKKKYTFIEKSNWKPIEINPELLSKDPTHEYNGTKVKLFKSTQSTSLVTVEFMEGKDKGKWLSVPISELIPLPPDFEKMFPERDFSKSNIKD